MMGPGLFVTGTDTGVGKTRITSAIVRIVRGEGRRVGVCKPVATGATFAGGQLVSEDAEELALAAGVDPKRVTPLLLEAPLAPPVAARRAGMRLTREDVFTSCRESLCAWGPHVEMLVVEGVGGFLCPIADGTTVADLAVELDFPLIIVGRRGLGTLNHVLMTVECAERRGLRVAGVVLNSAEPGSDGLAEETNPLELTRWLGDVPILAETRWSASVDATDEALRGLDWMGRSKRCRLTER